MLNRLDVRSLVLCAALVACGAVRTGAFGQATDQTAIKAGFLYNFMKFTEWPADIVAPGAPVVACFTDGDIAAEFAHLTGGRAIEDHPIVVRRLKSNELPAGCALYYISHVNGKQLAALLAASSAASALSVSDDEGFAEHGGMVGLFVEDGHMRFTVNTTATEGARLRMRANLLSLAKIVKDRHP